MSDITLAAPVAANRADWARLWEAYLAFYQTSHPEAVFDAAFAKLLDQDPATFQGLIAWRGVEAVGLVHWVWHPHMWRPEGVIYLQDLFVAPAARGMGVGTALIKAVYADADSRAVPTVYWMTQSGNPAAKLYDQVATRTDFVKYQRPAA
jgi:GNAT superfamily N-acetyltransferase